jgi:2-polyprenyl-3-methyl-5-hydroxy-6-metoxy-1,4-benzoquinol methylase
MDLSQRSYEKELLDDDGIPFTDIEQNMHELEIINSALGGHHITLIGFKKLLANKKEIAVAEIGCGGGDNLAAIKKWCIEKNIAIKLTGIDINADCITVANSNSKLNGSSFIIADYKMVKFEEKPDIIFSSLFCHHFTHAEIISMLRWMKQNATIGFFINDLHRHFLAYHSIKWVTKIFSKSHLVKNDAPLSVLRGFKKKEWMVLLKQAGIKNYSVQWKWAFRWLIISLNNSNE